MFRSDAVAKTLPSVACQFSVALENLDGRGAGLIDLRMYTRIASELCLSNNNHKGNQTSLQTISASLSLIQQQSIYLLPTQFPIGGPIYLGLGCDPVEPSRTHCFAPVGHRKEVSTTLFHMASKLGGFEKLI